ncbi:MAG: DUF5696 domain-containing protein [Eubacteriales bacterium]
MKRILALLLTVITMFGTFAVNISAAAVPDILEKDKDGKDIPGEVDWTSTLKQYLTLEFKTEQEKLESMTMMYEKDGYQLWIDDYTGEVATVNVASGQILFSNPYDIGSTSSSDSIKAELFSQIVVKYTDNDTEKYMHSFTEAASRGQINFKYIKNGIRVEYSIGREETRMLVPRQIERSRFEDFILQPFADEINKISEENGCIVLDWREYLPMAKRNNMIKDSSPTGQPKDGNNEWFKFVKLLAFYSQKFLGECETEKERRSMLALYPITKKMDIYVCTPDISRNELITIEGYLKTYVPTYTFEQLEADHLMTEYEGQDKSPPLFKMALEYTLDEMGMTVRLPANGLRFDESLYQLTYVSILPYMGAGANYLLGDKDEEFTGYNFFPDGSGTLFRHEELNGKANTVVNGKVYGQDFAYNTIVGANQQVIRYPVFGIVSNTHRTESVKVEKRVTEEVTDANGNVIIIDKDGSIVNEHKYEEGMVDIEVTEDKGFVAIIEEGDALAELSDYHMGSSGKYNTIQMLFYPRPKDSYNLANAISVGANATWTVVSSRKYVGNYKIRYIMLTDDQIAEEKGMDKYYECSWMGMAEAYRDYLYSKGDLESLTEKDVQADIPMYIETFGTLETLEKIMSIPVNVMTSLTSFENVKTMYDELSAEGVSNIKFKLRGYANGGMYSSVPYKLEWEKSVGGASGFKDLLDYSAEKGFEVFPEFDFVYVGTTKAFDGLTLKKHIVKSINDTYMSRRYYSATRQTHVGRYELAISAAYYSHFYDKLTSNLLKYYEDTDALKAISVSTLGTDLNSDFDEDEPYNREDNKKYTMNIFSKMDEDYDLVMTEGANAYTWKYVDYIINVPLDSSRYNMSSNSVPFIGVVLHGSVQFAGTPLNMEGNIGYSMLKAIENGAGLYFILCYENYEELKEDHILSEYYSVRYDILKDDVVRYYTILNDLTKDLQLSKIVGHKFLIGERVPDPDEVIADEEALKKEQELAEQLKAEEEAKKLQEALLEGRVYAASVSGSAALEISKIYADIQGYYKGAIIVNDNGIVSVRTGMQTLIQDALAKAAIKNPLESTYQLANAWDKANKLFASNYPLTGVNQIRADLEKALASANTSLTLAINAVPEKEAALLAAVDKAVAAKIASLPTLVQAYDKAVADRDAITDVTSDEYAAKQALVDEALAAITKYVASLDDARAYANAYNAMSVARATMASILTQLTSAKNDAVTAYENAQKAAAVLLAENAEYLAKTAELKELELQRAKLTTVLMNLKNNLSSYSASYPDSYEHKLLISYIADYEAKIEVATDAVNAKQDEIDALYATVDAGFAALKSAAEAATALVANPENDASYAAEKAVYDANTQIIDTLTAALTPAVRTVYENMIDEYTVLSGNYTALTSQLSAMELAAYTGADYDRLAAAVEDKKNALTALTEGYVNDATYIDLVEKLTASIDAKIAELVAKIDGADAATQIKLANEIASLMSVKYQKVTIPKNIGKEGANILLEVEKNSDGYVIGGGYIVNDYITKYKTNIKKSAEYTALDKELDTATLAFNSYKNGKLGALKSTDDYKALKAQADALLSEMNAYDLDTIDFRNALTQLINARANEISAQAKADAAKAALDAAEPYTGVDAYEKVLAAYTVAMAPDANILTKYPTALKDYNTAFGYVKTQITSVNSLFKNLDTQADILNTALKNSDIAKKYYHSDEFRGVYSPEFLADLDNVYAETFENTKSANVIVDEALVVFIDTLTLAKTLIPNTNADLELTALRVVTKDDGTIEVPEIIEDTEEEEEEDDEDEYEYTKYTEDSGYIVYIEYDNGAFFILNYNDFAVVTVLDGTAYTIKPYGGVLVNAEGTTRYFKATEGIY